MAPFAITQTIAHSPAQHVIHHCVANRVYGMVVAIVIQYRRNAKASMVRERTPSKGYAIDYEAAIKFIMVIVPSDETIVSSLRGQVISCCSEETKKASHAMG